MLLNKKEKLYQCPECGFWYKERKWAERCQVWCKKYRSCNLEIVQQAVKGSSSKKK